MRAEVAASLGACALVALLAAPVGGAADVLPLWPEGVPRAQAGGGVERLEDGRIYNVQIPTLTYVPPTASPSGAAVIVCPGGGYGRLAMANEPAGVTARLAREG